MAAAEGVVLNHFARISPDVKRLAQFYIEIFGFEEEKITPDFTNAFIGLNLPTISLHLIETDDPNFAAPLDHIPDPNSTPIFLFPHFCVSVTNFDSFVQTLQEKGIKYRVQTFTSTKTRHVFFFDPDGNGLEACTLPSPMKIK